MINDLNQRMQMMSPFTGPTQSLPIICRCIFFSLRNFEQPHELGLAHLSSIQWIVLTKLWLNNVKKKLYRVTEFFFIFSRICFTKFSPFCSNLLEMPFQCPKFRLRIRAEFQNTKFLPQNSKNGTQKRENSFI